MTQTLKLKAKALTLYAAHAEQQLTRFGLDLASRGYSPDEIGEAIDAVEPVFREGAESVLRQVTIKSLLADADHG